MRKPGKSLTVPTSYTVMVPGPTMARPGSTQTRGTARPAVAHSFSTISRSRVATSATSSGASSEVYAIPQTAAEVELGEFVSELVADGRKKPDHAMRRQPETRCVEDLRADMGVHPDQLEVRDLPARDAPLRQQHR